MTELETPGPEPAATITLSLISHTNVGKTTLARTLLRRDVGEVLDQAHVTEEAESHLLIAAEPEPEGGAAGAELYLSDTPGFGDSARLLTRLRKRDRPVLWFLQQTWDRFTDRPFWCSQQAALEVRERADVVLYLVNATEEPEEAGYVDLELELLDWPGGPVLLLLNQTGDTSFRKDPLA
ncbi:MAG: 50S ribosome-binding GTPase, partial [Holophagales bacterium]|nr:50S ribosome-binding GTPase [Holophagales bacterium]